MALYLCPECKKKVTAAEAEQLCHDCGGALKRAPIVASIAKPQAIVARVVAPTAVVDEEEVEEEEDLPKRKSGLKVTTKFFPLAFLLFFCKPRIEIDGKPYPRSWGTHFFKLPPGRYKLRIYFPYVLMSECGLAKVRVTIHPGEVTQLTYEMPPWMFAGGSITIRRR